jgi:hypothetical protein
VEVLDGGASAAGHLLSQEEKGDQGGEGVVGGEAVVMKRGKGGCFAFYSLAFDFTLAFVFWL